MYTASGGKQAVDVYTSCPGGEKVDAVGLESILFGGSNPSWGTLS